MKPSDYVHLDRYIIATLVAFPVQLRPLPVSPLVALPACLIVGLTIGFYFLVIGPICLTSFDRHNTAGCPTNRHIHCCSGYLVDLLFTI